MIIVRLSIFVESRQVIVITSLTVMIFLLVHPHFHPVGYFVRKLLGFVSIYISLTQIFIKHESF